MPTDPLPEDDQHDLGCEGFGKFDVVKGDVAQAADQRKSYRQTGYELSGNIGLARRVMFKPMRALFNQDKSLPLRYCPIQIEFEFVNSQADAVSLETAEGFQNGSNWDISDIQCKCDLLALDTSLDNEYASLFLSGKSFPISFNIWNHTNQSTGLDKNFSAHIAHAVVPLKSIFLTLHKPDVVAYKQANDFLLSSRGQWSADSFLRAFISSSNRFKTHPRIFCQFAVRKLQQIQKTVG